MFWSGLLVGGAVTAIAKFRVKSIPRHELIKVGRVQFNAIRRIEWVCAGVASVAAWRFSSEITKVCLYVAVSALACQRFVTVPIMQRKQETAVMMKEESGNEKEERDTSPSGVHKVHVALEMVKLVACLSVAVFQKISRTLG